MKVCKLNLPKTIGVWTRPDSPRVINSENIFDYMNGAGELYLGYCFNHLEVYEYTADDEKSILVELYYMKTSDDAFGLLSLDWGGEHVFFSDSPANTANQSLTSSTRALYGAGLLRIWSDNLYSRAMAFRETPASKQAVLTLGKAIAANRKSPPEPELLKILPLHIGSEWCSHCALAREGTGPQPLQAKTRAKTQSKNQISIVSPEFVPGLQNYLPSVNLWLSWPVFRFTRSFGK